MLATLLVTTLVTVPWTLAMPVKMLNWMLAGAVICAVALMSCRPKFDIPPRQEAAWSTGVGALSGLMGGISSLTGPVVISYLMALKLSREEFVGSVSVIYLFGAVPLYGSMVAHHRLGASEALVSAIAMVPVACGLAIGKRLGGHLDERSFRRVLLTFLIVVALALILK